MRGGLRHRHAVALRALALATVVLVGCSAATPPAPTPRAPAQSSPTPTPTPIPPLKPAHSVSPVGLGVAASGDFRGNGKSQIALLEPAAGDASLQIAVREPNPDGETFAESVWLTTEPNTFRFNRAKFAVADVTGDGRDDLVAVYGDAEERSGVHVFDSSGSALPTRALWGCA